MSTLETEYLLVQTSDAPLILVKEIMHFFVPEILVTEGLPLGQLLVLQYWQNMLIDQPMQCSVGLVICQNPIINILRSCNPYQHLKEFVPKQGGLLIPTLRFMIEIGRSERTLEHSLSDGLIVHLGHTTELEELIVIHLRWVPTVRYNAHPNLLELCKVVLQEILDLLQVSRILHKPLNLPPFEIVIQTARYDFMIILLPFFEDRVFMEKYCLVDVDLEALGKTRDLFIAMWNYMAIIVELEVHVASKLVVLDAHTPSCIDFLFYLVVYWSSEHEVRATRLDKDRKHESIRWIDDFLVIYV